MLSKTEFITNYLPVSEQRLAVQLLPDGERDLTEWRSLYVRALNSPAR